MVHAGAVSQPHHVASSAPLREQRFNPVLDAPMTEIAQKGIARAQRQESQRRRLTLERLRVETIHDFIRSAVPADGNEVSYATPVRFARNLRRFAGRAG